MVHSLGAIFKQLSLDPDVRAIVLSGAGPRAFTAGLDVQAASESGPLAIADSHSSDGQPALDTARRAILLRRHILQFQASVSAVEACEKPVIAVLHGISYGIALDITTCCDVRFCSTDVRFAVKEVDIGLAADVGTLTDQGSQFHCAGVRRRRGVACRIGFGRFRLEGEDARESSGIGAEDRREEPDCCAGYKGDS
jgi:enoyl-CoA hydratase/carnithine racemase